MITVLKKIALLCSSAVFAVFALNLAHADTVEIPILKQAVLDGKLPPMAARLPKTPLQVSLMEEQSLGQYGGTLNSLIGNASDVKLMFVYGYARLVGYTPDLKLAADIAESYEVTDNKIFTFKLREGHRWSNGDPFTSEDFRYWWEDIANNKKLSPTGPPASLQVDGEYPMVTFPDALTVRYEWSMPNPDFLGLLASASPLLIYRPAENLKPHHERYIDKSKLSKIQKIKLKSWASKHNRLDNLYKFDNPSLPTLQPWVNTTSAPANRFVGVRNAYFHRVDSQGRQLPYIDRMVLSVSEAKLISAKAASGDVDLQARAIKLQDATFLKANEKRSKYKTLLWPTVRGSHFTLYPNLNANDPVWRKLMRDVRFRRALSLGIDREEVNDVLFFGLAKEGNNTVQEQSSLYVDSLRTRWAVLDIDKANALLDEVGLTNRDKKGLRLLPDGRSLSIIVETAGESSERADVLELIRDSWRELGIALYTKPSQRTVYRNRIFAGETLMSVWWGLENGVPSPSSSPAALAATSQTSYQWPKWGQYHETKGQSGKPVDMPEVAQLNELYLTWKNATSDTERTKIWAEMLNIHAEQQYTIGVVSGILQPVVVANILKNVPKKAIFNWNPGAHFGVYHPDLFWFDSKQVEE
ncbi:MAG: ABC transporter substrate-binding protein [Pseudomonas marincola]